jgi:rhodanese-related sulfurtransferase
MNVSKENLPKVKQTVLGLHVTAREAYAKWQADPEKVMVSDVRTLEEYLFVGHPTMAWNIPVFAQTHEWDAAKHQFPMKPLPDFVSRVQGVAKPNTTLLVTGRAGGRAATAISMLAQAGFKQVYNIVDGVEGDPVDDTGSVFHGMPMRNGWKNSGCPWTYQPNPEQMVLPKAGQPALPLITDYQ